jgi:hypothetical protein
VSPRRDPHCPNVTDKCGAGLPDANLLHKYVRNSLRKLRAKTASPMEGSFILKLLRWLPQDSSCLNPTE